MSNGLRLGSTSRKLIPDHGLRGGAFGPRFKGYAADGRHHAVNDDTEYGHITAAVCGAQVYAWNTTYPSGGSASGYQRCDVCLEAARPSPL